jgi:hypothetical protein
MGHLPDRIRSEPALTFDDVLLVPRHSLVHPKDVSTTTRFTRGITLHVPLVSAAMDTVTEARLAIAIAQDGGIANRPEFIQAGRRRTVGELAAVVLMAQPIGWLIGYGIGLAMVAAFSSDLYRVPFVLGREVFATASLIVLAAALVSAIAIRGRINNLDMIEVLKTRE